MPKLKQLSPEEKIQRQKSMLKCLANSIETSLVCAGCLRYSLCHRVQMILKEDRILSK